MNIETAKTIGEILQRAAVVFSRGNIDRTFAECVGSSFWSSFGRNEQSHLMQCVYTNLCDMGFVPLESHQNY